MSHLDSLPEEAGFLDSTDHFQYNVKIKVAVLFLFLKKSVLAVAILALNEISWCALNTNNIPTPC